MAVWVPVAIFVYAAVDKIQGNTFIVAAKNEHLDSYLREYYDELQSKTATQGFKRFEPNEGEIEKMIVLSLGKEKKGKSMEVTGIEKKGDWTTINVKTFL